MVDAMQSHTKVLLAICISFFASTASALDIARCGKPEGHAYYPQKGLVKKSDSGWNKYAITSGVMMLTKNNDDKFDLLYVDSTQRITSTIADGGTIIPIRLNPDDLAFVIGYKDVFETYNF